MKAVAQIVRGLCLVGLLLGSACQPGYRTTARRFPEQYPMVLAARWALRLSKRRHRGPWEACWRHPKRGFMIWYGPFGQNVARMWITERGVTWDNVRARERWTVTNDARGWEALVGLPLHGGEVFDWFAGRFRPPGAWTEKVQADVEGLKIVRFQGHYRAFSFQILQFPDGRQWRQVWTTPWGPTVRIEYRYAARARVPVQLVWAWEDAARQQTYLARWDAMKWSHSDCRIPDQTAPPGFQEYRVENWFNGRDPMLVHIFRSIAQ